MATESDDPLFGKLVSDGLMWFGSTRLFGEAVTLLVPSPDDRGKLVPPDELQREAFKRAATLPIRIRDEALEAMLAHYLRVAPSYRDGLSDDEVRATMPIISTTRELAPLLSNPSLYVAEQRRADERVLMLDWDCTWDGEQGIRVMLLNEQVHAVLGQGDGWQEEDGRAMESTIQR